MSEFLTKIQCWLFDHCWSKWRPHSRGIDYEPVSMYRFCVRCKKLETKEL